MKRRLLQCIILVMLVALTMTVLFACGDDTEGGNSRQAVEDKLTEAGFSIVTSTSGAGLIEGTVIVEKDGFDETVVIQIYKNKSNVPSATTAVTKPCNNYYITSTSEELVALVYDVLK